MFRIVMYAFKCYVRGIMYPPILEILHQDTREIIGEPSDVCSTEVCRTFAGLEDSYLGEDSERFLPLFSPLILATTTCPPEIRLWLWYKLAHFEKLGHLTFDPVKRNLAALWEMPEITTERCFPLSKDSSPQIFGPLSCDDIEATMREVKLEEVEMSSGVSAEDARLEPLTMGRGLYGLSDN